MNSHNHVKDFYNSSIQSGAHGEKYQNDVALLLLERATRQNIPFKLAYEMTDAGKFDDVVMFNELQNEWIFVQTKHGINGKLIEWASLFPDDKARDKNSDFSLFKYFKSFLEVERLEICQNGSSRRYIIFTNRDIKDLEKLEPCHLKHKLLECGQSQHLKLIPGEDIVNLLHTHANQELQMLGEAIVQLFNSGKVEKILQEYKTPLKAVLTKNKDDLLQFSDAFLQNTSNADTQGLYGILTPTQSDLGRMKQPVNANIKKLFEGDSRQKILPSLVERAKVTEFLDKLVLAVGQPDDIRCIINADLQTWLKTRIPPDDFGKMTQTQLELPTNILDEKFQKFNENLAKENVKKYFKLSDGKNFLDSIRTEIETQLRNPLAPGWETIKNYYIHRKILYNEEEDEAENDVDATFNIPHAQKVIRDNDFVKKMKDTLPIQKCLILIAEPGTGKSVLLQYISMELQRQKIYSVFLIYLSHLHSTLKNAKAITSLDEALDTLQSVISENHCNTIRSAANNDTNNDRIIIFCDGFDEVHPDQRDKLIQILKQLLSVECVQIVISGRKSVKLLLEQRFKVKTMGLVQFNEDEQNSFLRKYWNVPVEGREKRFESYSNSLLKKFNSDIKSSQYKFTGLPLMIRMLAETYKAHFQNFWRSNRHVNEGEVFPSKTMDIVDLFEQFVVRCFKVKINKKLGVSIPEEKIDDEFDVMYDQFVEEHQALALRTLSLIELQRSLRSRKRFNESYDKFTARICKGTDKSLLVNTFGNEVQFTHLSYAEYLVAKFLYDRFTMFSPQFSGIFQQHTVIRRFFFKMVEKSESCIKSKYFGILHTHLKFHMALYACEANCYDLMKRFGEDQSFKDLSQRLMGILFHVAVKNDCDKICSFLINDSKCDVNCPNGSSDTPLHIAAFNGCFDVLSLLLDNGALVNSQKTQKWTSLHCAASRGHHKIVELLIGKGANVDFQEADKWTPLHLAAQNGHVEVVKVLITNGATIDCKNSDNCTPLQVAVQNGHADIVKFMLESGASKDFMMSKSQWSPLKAAVRNGHVDVIEVLFKNSTQDYIDQLCKEELLPLASLYGQTDVARVLIESNFAFNIQCKNSLTSLHYAAREGYADFVELLIKKGASISIQNENGWTPLHSAAYRGHIKVAKLLVKNHITVNVQEVNQHTPLHFACIHGHKDVVELLLENGALQDIPQVNKQTPLHLAAQSGHTDIVRLLLDRVQDPSFHVNVQEISKCTPLHLAAKRGHTETVELLIELGTSINIQNGGEWTPLHFAAQYGQVGVVKKLIDKGADINAQQIGGWAPLHFAAQNGHTEVMNLLIDHGATLDIEQLDKWTPLYIAVNHGFVNAVKLLIEKGAKVNNQQVGGWTPLHFAAQNGHFNVVKLLIQMGAEVKLQHKDTPIHLAIRNCHYSIAKLLLEEYRSVYIQPEDKLKILHYVTQHGHVEVVQLLIGMGVVDSQQESGWTPLHTAAQNGDVSVAKLLVSANYNVNIRTICGHTPLHIAVTYGRQEVVELLLDNGTDVHIVNVKGKCALDLALSNNNEQIVDMLRNPSISPVNHLGPFRENLTLLLEKGPSRKRKQ